MSATRDTVVQPVRITTLVENTAGKPNVLGEHGLSFWIETFGLKVLFDTGQGRVLPDNAQKLHVDLSAADTIVLSHGHYDHTGGLDGALRAAPGCTVYAHPGAFEPKYGRNPEGVVRSIGMPLLDEQAVRQRARGLTWTLGPTQIGQRLFVTGPVPRRTDFEDTGGPFFLDQECLRPDPITDDQAVWFQSPRGIVVVLGCAHAGVVNTLTYVRELAGAKSIWAVLGGMHLHSASPLRLTRTVEALRELGVERLWPAHCTGPDAVARLWWDFPTWCAPCPVGTTVEFA